MVLKLIKNEFKDNSTYFLPIISMILGVTFLIILPQVTYNITNVDILNFMIILIIFAFSIAVIVMLFSATINILYTSLYDKNGYRLFTLPVKSWEIIVSKIVVFALWAMIIGIITFIAFLIIIYFTFGNFDVVLIIRSLFEYIFDEVGLKATLIATLYFISNNLMLIALFMLVGSITNSSLIRNKRKIKTFIFYIIAQTSITQLFYYLNIHPDSMFNLGLSDSILFGPINPVGNGWQSIITIASDPQGLKQTILLSVIYLVISIIFFIATTYFWENKLEVIE